jgi:hypothetical protein
VKERKVSRILLDVLFLGLLMAYAIAGRDRVPLHGDESSLIAGMVDYYAIFHDGDLGWAKYQDPWQGWHPGFQLQRITTGSIHQIAMGIVFDLAGVSADDLNGPWEWVSQTGQHLSFEYNDAQGNVPGGRLLAIARTPSTLFLALSILVLFAIVWRLSRSRLAAYTACLVYTSTPTVLINGRRAMQEGPLLFFSALTILLALCAIQAQTGRRGRRLVPLGWYVALGVAGGLAVASKHTSVMAFCSALLAVLVAPLTRSKKRVGDVTPFNWRHVCGLAGAGLLSTAVFFLLTPVWWSWARVVLLGGMAGLIVALALEWNGWPAWAARAAAAAAVVGVTAIHPAVWPELAEPPAEMIEWRLWLMEIQAGPMGGMRAFDDRLPYLLHQAFFAQGEYYESLVWGEFALIKQQEADYESSGLAGRPGGLAWGVVLIMLLALGTEALAVGRFWGPTLLVALWLLVPASLLLATNPLAWQRYYLGLHAPLAVLCGLGVRQAATAVFGTRDGRPGTREIEGVDDAESCKAVERDSGRSATGVGAGLRVAVEP